MDSCPSAFFWKVKRLNSLSIQPTTTRGPSAPGMLPRVQRMEQPPVTQSQPQPAATLEMSTTKPQFYHDSTEMRVQRGFMSVRRSIEEFSRLGKQGAMEGVGRRAEQGRQLMDAGPGQNVLSQLAKENSSNPMKTLGIKFVDNTKLQMAFQPGTLTIKVRVQ